jgi:hypothetical protein
LQCSNSLPGVALDWSMRRLTNRALRSGVTVKGLIPAVTGDCWFKAWRAFNFTTCFSGMGCRNRVFWELFLTNQPRSCFFRAECRTDLGVDVKTLFWKIQLLLSTSGKSGLDALGCSRLLGCSPAYVETSGVRTAIISSVFCRIMLKSWGLC